MEYSWINNRIRYEFRSIPKLLLHFSMSLIEMASTLAILGLQITLTVTETCPYHIAVGFWSIPILLLAPVSIWIVIWRRNSIACFFALITHLIGTLFATSIIIISFLALINRIQCSTLSLNSYLMSLNSILIGIASFYKIFTYLEMILIWKLRQNTDQIPTIFLQEPYKQNGSLVMTSSKTNTYISCSNNSSETCTDLDYFFIY